MGMFDKNISDAKRASLELAEDSRESGWKYPSYLSQLFSGRVCWDLIHPYPKQNPLDKKTGDEFLARLEEFLKTRVRPDDIDKTGDIPKDVIAGLFDIGAFAIKIPKDYGGLGLSQVNYNRAIHLVASYCGSTAVLLSAHQSIGVPQPLLLYGTEEQKRKYLPRFRKNAISAFALTEANAGSDPRSMTTTATPTSDGKHFLINGKKLWCTNGNIADVIVVMAVTPPKVVHGKERKQITAFIVETDTSGFRVEHRCSFMGLHGIQNGIITFDNVKVPRENIILGEGQGLKLALMTLNTGRLTVPAAVTGMAKWCLNVCRRWAGTREQWGSVIGEHESISTKLAMMGADTLALEAMTWLVSHMADSKKFDIRLEAACAKLFGTEISWKIADEAVQIRGGCGYETSSSLRGRGETDFPVERVLRDARINRIIEGTTEIMHLFIAREALDAHMGRIKPLLDPRSTVLQKLSAFISAVGHYFWWLPAQYIFKLNIKSIALLPPRLSRHMFFVERASRKLARRMFYQMIRHQKKLEAKQNILNRFVDIGTDLFAISSVCSYASESARKGGTETEAVELADLFCQSARERVVMNFRRGQSNSDKLCRSLARKILNKKMTWLENDIVEHRTEGHNGTGSQGHK